MTVTPDGYEAQIRKLSSGGWSWRVLRNGEIWYVGSRFGWSDGTTATKTGAVRMVRTLVRSDRKRNARHVGAWERVDIDRVAT